MFLFFPDTRGLPLEEVAAIFGDQDEVAVYARDLEVDVNEHKIVEHEHTGGGMTEKQGFSHSQ